MNNTVEKCFCWIYQGKVATVYRWGGQVYRLLLSNFFQDLTHQKSLKSVNFWPSYLTNKKVEVSSTQCRLWPWVHDRCVKYTWNVQVLYSTWTRPRRTPRSASRWNDITTSARPRSNWTSTRRLSMLPIASNSPRPVSVEIHSIYC